MLVTNTMVTSLFSGLSKHCRVKKHKSEDESVEMTK